MTTLRCPRRPIRVLVAVVLGSVLLGVAPAPAGAAPAVAAVSCGQAQRAHLEAQRDQRDAQETAARARLEYRAALQWYERRPTPANRARVEAAEHRLERAHTRRREARADVRWTQRMVDRACR